MAGNDVNAILPASTTKIGTVYQVSGQQVDEGGVVRSVSRAFADPAAAADNAIVAAQGAGVKIRVLAVTFSVAGANNVRFRSAANNISNLFTMPANSQVSLPFNPHGWFQTNANEALNLNLSAATAVGVSVVWAPAA